MTRRIYDLVVLGDDAPGVAAAACASRAGASVAVVGAGKSHAAASEPAAPDFVWRRLDLHESGYESQPVASRVSLFADGTHFATFADDAKTRAAIEAGGSDGDLWTDYRAAMARMLETFDREARPNGDGGLLALLASTDADAIARALSASCLAVIDDYFEDEKLKTHLASVALTPFSLGGDEPGSAAFLAAAGAREAWPTRRARGESTLRAALARAAENAGVEQISATVAAITPPGDKVREISLENGDVLRARAVLASSPDADPGPAEAVALQRARVRLRLAEAAAPQAGDPQSLFYVASAPRAFADGRDAALSGKIPTGGPLTFELRDADIYVTAPYCPARLTLDDEPPRDWTEQDRQAFGRQVLGELAPYFASDIRAVRRIDVALSPVRRRSLRNVPAPSPRHDAIGSSVRLAMELING